MTQPVPHEPGATAVDTHALIAERREKLAGPIVRLEHPIEVRFKGGSLFARSRVGFCERLGLDDMNLNTEKPPRLHGELRLDLLFPPPTGPMRLAGTVEDVEVTRPRNWCAYITFKHVSAEDRKVMGEFLVKAAKQV